MRRITVKYHHEDGVWWAESFEMPGFAAAADTSNELRTLVRDSISMEAGDEPYMLLEMSADWAPDNPAARSGGAVVQPPSIDQRLGYSIRRVSSMFTTNGRMALR